MSALQFTLGDWQGPLDLLLHLIAKHKMDITDIPIAELLAQYLDYLDHTPKQDLEEAADFLEMAARLVYIKTAMLLPRPEEGESLKQELTGELLEYRLCQEIAGELGKRSTYQEIFVRRPDELDTGPYEVLHDAALLLSAYREVMGKGDRKQPPPAEAFAGTLRRRFVPVSSRVRAILGLLYRQERVGYLELFLDSADRSELVATFLAVLELIRVRRVRLEGENAADLTVSFVPVAAGEPAYPENGMGDYENREGSAYDL